MVTVTVTSPVRNHVQGVARPRVGLERGTCTDKTRANTPSRSSMIEMIMNMLRLCSMRTQQRQLITVTGDKQGTLRMRFVQFGQGSTPVTFPLMDLIRCLCLWIETAARSHKESFAGPAPGPPSPKVFGMMV